MDESSGPAHPSSLGPYTILRRLGAGGMGEVLLARDPKLGREVALKILPEELRGSEDRRTRFLREAKAVAQLSHPNVTQIFEIGEADGQDFIAFEYVDGQTLQELLASRRLSLQEIVDLALPLADAIEYAHERGVVHRDLKPANVMLTQRGLPKLLDFGLAKLLHEDSNAPQNKSTTLTMQGAIFGTPNAMSPEQALGRPVDERSDVFSYGSLLYEIAAGRPAFGGETAMEVLDAVIHQQPESLAKLRPDLPPELLTIVERAMRKDPAERYPSMAGVAADLRHFKRHTESGLVPPGSERGGRRLAPVGMVALLLVVVGVALGGWFLFGGGPDGPSPGPAAGVGGAEAERVLAVLFFENVTDPEDPERIGVMLAHLLTTELSGGGGLDVLSQQRLFELARRAGRADGTVDRAIASEVARLGGIGTMVLGEVLDAGGRLVATASLVDVESGTEVAAVKAQGEGSGDVFAMAEALGADVRALLAPEQSTAGTDLSRDLTSSVEAYRAYVRGRERMMQRDPFGEAIEAFEESVEIDPAFALAHFWLGIAQNYMSRNEEASLSFEKAAAFREKLPEDVRRTLEVAQLYSRQQQAEAIRLGAEVLREDPQSLFTHYMLGEIYIHSPIHVDPEKAAEHFGAVAEIDPGFSMIFDHLLFALVMAGRGEVGWTLIDGWELEDEKRSGLENILLIFEGRLEEARLRAGSRSFDRFSVLLDRDELNERLDELDREELGATPVGRRPARYRTVAVYAAGAGRFDLALDLLDEVPFELQGTDRIGWLANITVAAHMLRAELEALRGDPEEAHRVAEEALAMQPDGMQPRYFACLNAARAGRLEVAREHARRLGELTDMGRSPVTADYRDAALAEVALLEGNPEEARRLYAGVVESNLLADWFVANNSKEMVLRARFAEVLLLLGEDEAARAQLRLGVDSLTAVEHPLRRFPALLQLARLEREAGNTDQARADLEDLLGAWGESDWDLELVAEAREMLDELR